MYYQNVRQITFAPSRVITVTGKGKVNVQPNFAQLQIEVSTRSEDVSEAQQENAVIMNRVIQSILALNIPREDIQTTAFTIVPTYDYIEGRQVFRGYEVTNAITVKVKDVSQVGTVIDTAVQNGANQVSSIQFGVENEDIYYQQALRLALQDAQAKAKTIAETMKLLLYPQPIEIIEETISQPIPYRTMALSEQASTTPIEQGQISINASVRVKFQY